MTTPNGDGPKGRPQPKVGVGNLAARRAEQGAGKQPSAVNRAANTAARAGAASAITAATGGVGAPAAKFAASFVGTDPRAKQRRRLLIIGGVSVVLVCSFLLTFLISMALGTAVMGGGSGAAGTAKRENGQCLDVSAPRITQGGSGGRTAAAGSLGAPLDPQYMQSASGFGGRDAPTAGATSWHDGIDFSGPGIHGKPIYAPADGVVQEAGPASGYGNWILLNHTLGGQKVTTLYGHIEDGHLKVKAGDKVKAGQHIADVGNAGASTGPHLHFGVYPGGWKSQQGVDPMPWLKKFKAQSSSGQGRGDAPATPDSGGGEKPDSSPAQTPGQVTEADWDKLAEHESSGDWKINNGNGFSGGVQFTASTWKANGGLEYAPEAWKATKQEQMEVANQVLTSQGWGAWPVASGKAGIRDKKPAPKGTFAGKAGGKPEGGEKPQPGAGGDLPKSPKGDEKNLQAAAQRGMRIIAAKFPKVESIGGYRSGNNAMDHGTGSAVDAMIPDYGSREGIALGDQISKYFLDNAGQLKVKYVIWRNRIWENGSWTDYGSTGGDNDKHNNHVHVSFKQSGAPTSTVTGLPGDSAGSESGEAPDGIKPYEPKGEQKSQNLSPEQQANIKALISAAKRSGIKPSSRASVLAIAYAGEQTNFVSKVPTPEDSRIGIFGEVPLEGSDTGDTSNLINVPYAANRFFDRLKEVAEKDRQWATKPLPEVLTAMYPEQRTRAPAYGSWEQLAIGVATKLWKDPFSAANAALQQFNDNLTCKQGAVGGHNLKAGSVPQRFVKWIELAGRICEGMTAPLLAAQIEQESGFNEQATSSTGAQGSSQFQPTTWPTWGKPVDENGKPTGPAGAGDPRKASDATMAQGHMMCADYNRIAKLVKDGKVKGDPVALTLAAYNAGIGAIIEAGGMPSGGDYTTQTQPYVDKIMARAKTFDGGGNMLKSVGPSGSSSGGNQKIVDYARKQIKKAYVWGASGPDSFDCSGLTQQAYKAAGVSIPRSTYDQVHAGQEVSKEKAQPGDLVLSRFEPNPEHVSIYIGDGKVIQAHSTQVGVVETPLPSGKLMFRHVEPGSTGASAD